MNRVWITGDTHQYENDRFNTFIKNNPDLDKSDIMIILGDCGYYWDNEMTEKQLRKKIAKYPFTMCTIKGNHENFSLINKLPKIEWFGAEVSYDMDNKFAILENGKIYTIYDKTFWIMGGAHSIDKFKRREGISWWKDEIPTDDVLKEGISVLRKYNKIDYILSHTTSLSNVAELHLSPLPKMFQHENILEKYMENILHTTVFDKHYFAHFHLNKKLDDKNMCLYQQIVQLI